MLFVCSKSTARFIRDWECDNLLLVTGAPTAHLLSREKYCDVVAVGGGSVIDTAKMVCSGKAIVVPTTYSGASRTSHAVYWDNNRKCNLKTDIPTTLSRKQYMDDVPEDVLEYSKADCLCHILESMMSVNAGTHSLLYSRVAMHLARDNEWMAASLMAGAAIELTGTNLMHSLSYALYSLYAVPHAKALSYILSRLLVLYPVQIPDILAPSLVGIDVERVVEEAYTYPKINSSTVQVTKGELRRLLS